MNPDYAAGDIPPGTLAAEEAVTTLLRFLGVDPEHESVVETPRRLTKALKELTSGYKLKPEEILGKTFDAEGYDEIVIVTGIPFNSLCEHHMLPVRGVAAVAYLPEKKVVGLSKIPRLVQCFAKRLQLQERLTKQVADAMMEHLKPKGVAVVVRATHSCMTIRGVESDGQMVTSSMLGTFRDNDGARAEVLSLIRG